MFWLILVLSVFLILLSYMLFFAMSDPKGFGRWLRAIVQSFKGNM